jgi:hypothetical protein
MGKTTLVVGFGRALPHALASEAARRSRRVVLALAPRPGEPKSPGRADAKDAPPAQAAARTDAPAASPGDSVVELPYRPGSALSARGLFLEASIGGEPVSELILSCEPETAFRPLLSADAREAEAFVDERVKAWFQLIREALNQFRKAGKGAIAFCAPAPEKETRGMPRQSGFAALECSMFAALAGTTLPESTPEVPVYGFSGRPESDEDFAQAVFRALDEQSARSRGRWTRAGKGKLLDIF